MARKASGKGKVDRSLSKPASDREIRATGNFRMVVWITAGITVICLVGSIVLGLFAHENQVVKDVVKTLHDPALVGIGGIAGLIGGKSL